MPSITPVCFTILVAIVSYQSDRRTWRRGYDGSIIRRLSDGPYLRPWNQNFKRALRTFVLPFQPHVGMVLGTGTTEIVIDELEWSLEHRTFHAIVYIVEDSQCGEGDFINPAWSLKDLDPVDGYVEKFYARRPQYVEKITQCPSCNGTGLGRLQRNAGHRDSCLRVVQGTENGKADRVNTAEKRVLHGIYYHRQMVGEFMPYRAPELNWLIAHPYHEHSEWQNGQLQMLQSPCWLAGGSWKTTAEYWQTSSLSGSKGIPWAEPWRGFRMAVTAEGADMARELHNWHGRINLFYKEHKDGFSGSWNSPCFCGDYAHHYFTSWRLRHRIWDQRYSFFPRFRRELIPHACWRGYQKVRVLCREFSVQI